MRQRISWLFKSGRRLGLFALRPRVCAHAGLAVIGLLVGAVLGLCEILTENSLKSHENPPSFLASFGLTFTCLS